MSLDILSKEYANSVFVTGPQLDAKQDQIKCFYNDDNSTTIGSGYGHYLTLGVMDTITSNNTIEAWAHNFKVYAFNELNLYSDGSFHFASSNYLNPTIKFTLYDYTLELTKSDLQKLRSLLDS